MESRKAHVGPSIQIKGELIGKEDLVIEGKVEGVIRLRDHQLTIGKHADIKATLEAKSIRVEGKVQGDVVAGEKVELATGSSLLGDIVSPRISISEGARFKGSVDMDQRGPATTSTSSGVAAEKSTGRTEPARKPAGVS